MSSSISSITEWTDGTDLVEEPAPAADNVVIEDFDIQDLLEFDPANEPTNLLGNRWGCEGGSSLWAGGSGYGKSVLAMQAAVYWASGGAFFGIAPARALKILIVQAENDRGDTAEMLQGVIRGIAASGDMSESELRRILKESVVITARHRRDRPEISARA